MSVTKRTILRAQVFDLEILAIKLPPEKEFEQYIRMELVSVVAGKGRQWHGRIKKVGDHRWILCQYRFGQVNTALSVFY